MREDNVIRGLINPVPFYPGSETCVFPDNFHHLVKSGILADNALFMAEITNIDIRDAGDVVFLHGLMTELTFNIQLHKMLMMIEFNRLAETAEPSGKNRNGYNSDNRERARAYLP